MLKRCTKCGEDKPISSFTKDPLAKMGFKITVNLAVMSALHVKELITVSICALT